MAICEDFEIEHSNITVTFNPKDTPIDIWKDMWDYALKDDKIKRRKQLQKLRRNV